MFCKRAGLAAGGIAACFVTRPTRADTVNWTAGATGNWNVAANWTVAGQPANQHVPGSADTAAIANAIVSLTNNLYSVFGLNLTNAGLSNGTLNVSGASTFTGTNSLDNLTLNLNGGGSGSVVNMRLLNGANLNVGANQTLTLNNAALSFKIGGGNVSGNVAFASANGGSLYFDGSSSNTGTAVSYSLGKAGVFSGRLNTIGVSYDQYAGTNTTLNTAATFNLNSAGTTTQVGADTNHYGTQFFNNSGSFNATNGNNLYITASLFTNTGTVTQDTGTLTLSGTFNNSNGTLTTTNGGLLAVVNGNLVDTGNTSALSSLSLSNGILTSGTLNVSGATTFAAGSVNTLDGVTLNANGGGTSTNAISSGTGVRFLDGAVLNVANGQTINLNNAYLGFYNGGGNVSGNVVFNNANGGSLYFNGNPANTGTAVSYSLGSAGVFSGKINTIGVSYDLYAGTNATLTTAATFNLNSAGTTTQVGTDTNHYGTQFFNNSGNFYVTNGNNLYIPATLFTNTGTVAQDTGTLTLSGTFNNTTGTITTTSGGVLAVVNGLLIDTGNTSSLSSLNLSNGTLRNGTLNVSGATTFAASTVNTLDGVVVNANGGGTSANTTSSATDVRFTDGAVLNVGAGQSLTLNNAFLGFYNGGGNITGNINFANVNGGNLYFNGSSSNTGTAVSYSLGSAGVFSGKINLIGVGDEVYNGTNTTLNTAATFNLNSNGTTTQVGTDTNHYGTQFFNNSGSFNVTNGNNLYIPATLFTNTGSVSQDTGTLTLSGTFNNTTGTITTTSGGVLAVVNGLLIDTGNTSNLSSLNLSNGTLRNGTLNVSGATTFAASSTNTLDGVTLNANGGGTSTNATSNATDIRFTDSAILNVGAGQNLSLNNAFLGFYNGGGNVNGNIVFANAAGGNLYFNGNPANTGTAVSYALGSGGIFSGKINLIGVGDEVYNGTNATLNTAATFNLNSAGTTTQLGTDTNHYGTQFFNNSGSFNVTNGNNLYIPATLFTNTGNVSQDTGTLTLSGTFNNTTGTITTTSGGTLSVVNGLLIDTNNTSNFSNLNMSNGTLRNGTLNVSGATTFAASSVNTLDGVVVNANGGGTSANTTSSATDIRLLDNAVLNVGAGQNLSLNNAFLGFYNGGGNVNGNIVFANAAGGNLYFNGNPANTGTAVSYSLGSGGVFSGKINIIGVGDEVYNGTNATLNTAATFNLNSAGTTTQVGTDTNHYGTQFFNNSGSFNVTNGNNLYIPATLFANTGTVMQDTGTLTLSGTFNNSHGTLTTTNGGILAVVNGNLVDTGNTSALSSLNLSNGILTNGTLNVSGATTFAASSTNTLDGVTLNANGGGTSTNATSYATDIRLLDNAVLNVANGQSLNLNNAFLGFYNGGGNITGNVVFANAAGGNLYFNGNSSNTGTAVSYSLGNAGVFSGKINLIGVGDEVYNGTNATLNTAATFNLNSNGATTQVGTDTNHYGTQFFNNSGNFNVTNGNNLTIAATSFTNTGNVSLDTGTLTINGTFLNSLGAGLTTTGGGILTVNGLLINTGNTSAVSNLNFSTGTYRGGTYNVSGGTTFAPGATTLLDGVTVNAAGGFNNIGNNAVIRFTNNAAINVGANQTLNLNNGVLAFASSGGNVSGNVAFGSNNGGSLYFDGVPGNNNTAVTYNFGSGAVFSGNILNIGNGDYLDKGLNVTLNNYATFNLNNAVTTTLFGASGGNYGTQIINNAGSINVSNGNNLTVVANSFTNTGNVSQNTGTLTLNGNFYNTTGTLTTTNGGTLAIIGGVLVDTGNTTYLSNLNLNNGTLRGGTLNVNNITTFNVATTNLLDGVILNANGGGYSPNITANPTNIRFANNAAVNVAASQTLNLDNAVLAFASSGGNVTGNVAFGSNNGSKFIFDGVPGNNNTAVTYNFGVGGVFSGNIIGIGNGYYLDKGLNVTLNNYATFNLNNSFTTTLFGAANSNYGTQIINNAGNINVSNGNNLTIAANAFTNSGNVVQDTGTLTVNGTFNNTTGTLTTINGGLLALVGGTLVDTGNTTYLSNLNLNNGALRGGTVNVSGTSTFVAGTTDLLDGVTLNLNGGGSGGGNDIRFNNNAAVNVAANQTLNLNNAVLAFANSGGNITGNVAFGSNNGSKFVFDGVSGNNNTAVTYNFGAGGIFSGNIIGIGSGFDQYQGLNVTLNNAATFNLNSAGTTTIFGAASGNYGTQIINNAGNINVSNGNNLTIAANSFTNAGNISQNGGTLTLNGTFANTTGTLNLTNGTLAIVGGTLSDVGNSSFLSSLSLNNSILLNGTVNVSGATTFANTNLLNGATLNANGGGSGSGTIRFTNNALLNVGAAQTLSLNNSILAFANGGGNITGNVSFGSANGGSLYFDGVPGNANTAVAYNFGAGGIFGGRINGIGSNISVDNGLNITLNNSATFNLNNAGATTVLGVASGSNGVQIVNNAGNINVSNGNNLTVAANAFTNTGNINIASGTAAVFSNGAIQTAGKTIVDGSLTINASRIFAVQGGKIEGIGAITGAVANTGGIVTAGSDTSAGHLTETGNYTQGANGTYLVKLGGTGQGTTYDLFSIGGTASLSGKVEVDLLNAFTPFVGETFTFLNYTNHAGAFDSIFSADTGHSYSVTYGSNAATLNVGPAAVPETGTLVSMGLLLTGGAFALRRARRREQN